MKSSILLLAVLIFALVCPAQTEVKLIFGNPSGATADEGQPDNHLLVHSGFGLSYNKSRGAANWVTWHLSASDMADAERSNAFAPDQTLPRDWRIKPSDYAGSGYDQGHMCPSGDRTASDAANRETFLMSNMQPQIGRLNRVTWRLLEADTQKSVRAGNEAYVYAGCYGDQGRIKDKITVPTNCFKIVVLMPEGVNDVKRVTKETTVIAVDMPNDETIKTKWRNYRVSIDDIESKTGYDFFSILPDEIENFIEAKSN